MAPGRSAALLALCLAAAVAAPRAAQGNGRFPNAQHVWRDPTGRGLVLRATWGFALLSEAQPPRWACEDALGYGGEYDPAFVIDREGGVWLGLYDGLARIAPDRCAVTRAPALAGANVVDLDASPDGRVLVAVDSTPFTSGTQGITARLWRSEDGGATWQRAPATLTDALVDTVEMARTDVRRLYLSARDARSPAVQVFRSDDAGASWTALALPWAPEAESAWVAGIDPTDADRMYLRVVLRPEAADGALDATALYRTDDAGRTWRRVLQTAGPMLGVALHDDGRTLWAAGPDPRDGLRRSDDRGERWQPLAAPPLRCLRWAGNTLYACLDGASGPGPALARSDDRGARFDPVLDPCTMRPGLGCASGDDPAAACGALFGSTRALLGCRATPTDGGVDAGVANDAGPQGHTGDAAPAMDASPGIAGTGGCSVHPRPAGTTGVLGVLLSVAAKIVARRRRRGSPGAAHLCHPPRR